jgi:hypothetical protein
LSRRTPTGEKLMTKMMVLKGGDRGGEIDDIYEFLEQSGELLCVSFLARSPMQ